MVRKGELCMLINGYTVDKNLPAFRKAFFLPDILSELDHQFAFWKWASDMCDLPHLPQNAKDRLSILRGALREFFAGNHSNNWKLDQASYFERNAGLQKQILTWETKVDNKMKPRFRCVGYIILELMEIAEYAATEQDISTFLEYLQKHGYLSVDHPTPERNQLRIKLCDGKKTKLYYGDQIITDLPEAKNYPSKGFATVAEHPITGYLGITKDGTLINCSAFAIPALKKRPVKVLLNQLCYVVLQEDGSLLHNLRFCAELPSVPVRDVILNKDQIQWIPM